MEFQEVVRKRASVREYTDRPVEEKDLIEILELGVTAPSAMNLQPWYFVAIRNEEDMKKLLEVLDEFAVKLDPERGEKSKFFRTLGGAPAAILAFEVDPEPAYFKSAIHQSIAAALQNMILAAAEKGMGTCWMTGPVRAGCGEPLGDLFAPGKGKLVAMTPLGYPKGENISPQRREGRYEIR
jgi:nitroreductase